MNNQECTDSTTRKGLRDGIVSGYIPTFLSGIMSTDEFGCFDNFGGNNKENNPWYLVLKTDQYIEQLISLSPQNILINYNAT